MTTLKAYQADEKKHEENEKNNDDRVTNSIIKMISNKDENTRGD